MQIYKKCHISAYFAGLNPDAALEGISFPSRRDLWPETSKIHQLSSLHSRANFTGAHGSNAVAAYSAYRIFSRNTFSVLSVTEWTRPVLFAGSPRGDNRRTETPHCCCWARGRLMFLNETLRKNSMKTGISSIFYHFSWSLETLFFLYHKSLE